MAGDGAANLCGYYAHQSLCLHPSVWLAQPWGHGVQTARGAVEQWRATPAIPLLLFSTCRYHTLQFFALLVARDLKRRHRAL